MAPYRRSLTTAGRQQRSRGERRAATGEQRDEGLSRGQRIRVQRGLAALGFEAGPADGLIGPQTRSAIREWQQAKGLEPTGYLSRDQAEALAAAAGDSRQTPVAKHAAEPAQSPNQVLYFAAAGPKCPNKDQNKQCWKELSNKPGCHFWGYDGDYVTTWSGGCTGDTAHGTGTLRQRGGRYNTDYKETGKFVQGKRQGRWEGTFLKGGISDGSSLQKIYADGVAHGRSVSRFANGIVLEGPYVRGKQHGRWFEDWDTDGYALVGPYVHGKRHGHWIKRWDDGRVEEGPYVRGKKHGRWFTRHPDGKVIEQLYEDDKKVDW